MLIISPWNYPLQLALAPLVGALAAGNCAVNRNQYRPGVCTIAAPVLDEHGTPLATVAISMPDSRYDEDRLPEWGRLIADAAAEISRRRLDA
ncbi:aldehyde dehydrogenase family protein [Streptomyces sp. UG1]|uniref:aldehyde dehydrogenase family protein n=1 Tax=Streptomyces sp. UG1 TaxID=3417652 RepID=UPI003CF1DB26